MEHLPQLSGEKSSEKADRAPEDVLFRGAVFDRGAESVLEGQAAEITPGQIEGVVGGLSTQTGTDWAAAQVQGADMGALGGGDGHESGPTSWSHSSFPGPATPVADRAMSQPSSLRAPSAIARGHLRGDCAELVQQVLGHPQYARLHLIGVGDHPAPEHLGGAGMSVRRLAIRPPVMLSAQPRVRPFSRSRSSTTSSREETIHPVHPGAEAGLQLLHLGQKQGLGLLHGGCPWR